jgi:signal transduction histidine kinase
MKQEEISAKGLIAAAVKPFEIQMELMEMKTYAVGDDISLRCDINWTIEALQNIIKNCYEHMDVGGALKIETEDTNLFSRIKITDSGCGIPEGDLPHIFERFYKGKNAGKDSVGIGLALSKAVMESQRGDILVKSQEGVGTEFDVRFYKTII